MLVNFLYFPNINPIICNIGFISVYWYGLMYVISFLFARWWLLRCGKHINNFLKKKDIESILYISCFGILLGGRLGYVVFYAYEILNRDMWFLLRIWEGGMSFHGGLIGVIIGIIYFSYRNQYSFWKVSDFIVPSVPFGLAMGRLGNFINGELWGRVTINVPWGMFFPTAKYYDWLLSLNDPKLYKLFDCYGMLPRHPSQLYEMFLEGILLFIIINYFSKKSLPIGSVSGLFLILYGLFRIFVECFRQPDMHIGFFMNFITTGQILSFPMVIIGVIILFMVKNNYIV